MKTVLRNIFLLILFLVLAMIFSACSNQGLVQSESRSLIAMTASNLARFYSNTDINSLSGTMIRFSVPHQDIKGDKLVLGGSFTLTQGHVLEGSLFILGGTAILEEESVVEGDVVVMGGTLLLKGTVQGDVNVVGGLVTLNHKALIEGDINALGGNLLQDEGARIEGKVNKDVTKSLPFILPGRIQIPNWGEWMPVQPGDVRIPHFDISLNPVWDGMWLLSRSFLWAVLAVLVVLFLPKYSERAASVAMSQTLVSGGLGCLTIVVAPLFIVLFAITICGIPISLIGAIGLLIAWAFGIIILGMEVGKRLAHFMKQDWALPVSTGVGAFVLTLVINSIGALIPCVGWLGPAVVGVIGLGAVLLTRFGSQDYPPVFSQGTEISSEGSSQDLLQASPSHEEMVSSEKSDS